MEPYRYDLPDDRIAQRPTYPYHAARCLVVNREGGDLFETTFLALPDLLREGDLLLFNDSRVVPARLFGSLSDGTETELVLLRSLGPSHWVALGRPMRRFRPGVQVSFGDDLIGTFGERVSEGEIEVHFESRGGRPVAELLRSRGTMPIPPYIRSGRGDTQDAADYQTFFAREEGSVAAPTASLHFTPELVQALTDRGVEVGFVTLHVGAASIFTLERQGNTPGSERMQYRPELLDRISAVRARGGRVLPVGTTVIRLLESTWEMRHASQPPESGSWVETDIFLKPGHQFRTLDGAVTNFHQPGTTHLLLVEAIIGRKLLEEAYRYALAHGFRFLSYGDGMLIL